MSIPKGWGVGERKTLSQHMISHSAIPSLNNKLLVLTVVIQWGLPLYISRCFRHCISSWLPHYFIHCLCPHLSLFKSHQAMTFSIFPFLSTTSIKPHSFFWCDQATTMYFFPPSHSLSYSIHIHSLPISFWPCFCFFFQRYYLSIPYPLHSASFYVSLGRSNPHFQISKWAKTYFYTWPFLHLMTKTFIHEIMATTVFLLASAHLEIS